MLATAGALHHKDLSLQCQFEWRDLLRHSEGAAPRGNLQYATDQEVATSQNARAKWLVISELNQQLLHHVAPSGRSRFTGPVEPSPDDFEGLVVHLLVVDGSQSQRSLGA